MPGDRFDFLRDQLGDAFVDEPGQPTRRALDQVLDLFRTRLLESPAAR